MSSPSSPSSASITPAPIVAGVDGADATRAAIRHAALEAAARGVPLTLVHVVANLGDEAAYAPVDRDELLARGRQILKEAEDLARATAPGVRVHTDLHHGVRRTELAAAARGAAQIVIGGARPHGLDRIHTGSMAIGLAKHTTCPVVVVPADWQPGGEGPVLVGYKSPDDSFAALAYGFDLAAERGRELLVLHAWRLPTGYDDVIGARVSAERIEQHAREAIESLVADLRASHPSVVVRIRIRHGQAAQALVEASRQATAVVLSRPSSDLHPHLGGTDRAVLRHAACPVVFGTGGPAGSDAELVLEQLGHMER